MLQESLGMHLRTETDRQLAISMDPDSPLNRAHQCERKAERLINSGLYDAALQCYRNAADYIQEAMKNTRDAAALQSLKLQKESYDKMPLLVNKRREHSQVKVTLENIRLESKDEEKVASTKDGMTKTDGDQDNTDGGAAMDVASSLMSLEPLGSKDNTALTVRENRSESFEALDCEDLDSLLQFLQENSEVDAKHSRRIYSPAAVLRAIRSYTTRSAGQEHPRVVELSEQKQVGRKMDKDYRVQLEELEVQNSELRKHVLNLLEQLESCEQENSCLKSSMVELKQELETQKSRVLAQQSRPDFRNDFSVPFSLAAPMMNGMSASAESRIIIPQTPPALAPLEMPNFDDR
ncbi:uncharacterized protein [Diadema setosum]|uniref:uncharacterized protein n=1 Tax=Diadema setosum TaxID=31175 RepID=UPI003B3A5A76